MARKKKDEAQQNSRRFIEGAVIENSGLVQHEPITQTLEKNYMPYAMSVIVSRAIPEIDGFKPSHRKLLYTMYTMGLLTKPRTKSANVVGQTMKLNPHGDQTIYETLVRLSRGHEALLHPFVDSKGNFGKYYSRDMSYAASRYTECKLDAICETLFADIDKDTVDFEDNYDATMKEPRLLPAAFPTILVNSNVGIAVGMASSICSWNLSAVCDAAVARLKGAKDDEIPAILVAPDFPGGGFILYDEAELRKICDTGRGSVRVRARYRFDKSQNVLEVIEIPPTTTSEQIIDKVIELVKAGKVREISDIRDETDLGGLKIAIDCKRGVDPDALMQKLYKLTSLEDSFSCNMNVLIGGTPRVLGVTELLDEWLAFRTECVKRRVFFDLTRKEERLHLLEGLERILLDIDKAVKIVRETDEESEVVPNLMIGFRIDKVQAEYVAEIRLRQLNREHILRRTAEIGTLRDDIADLKNVLETPKRVRDLIVKELGGVKDKYGRDRRSEILYERPDEYTPEKEEATDYPVHLFFTREGYFKKITPQSLRMSSEQKLKDGDAVEVEMQAQNLSHLLFFTDKAQVYKAQAYEFEDTKASVMGDYVPAQLGMDEGENAAYMAVTSDYEGYMLFFFENGRIAKVPMKAYETKQKRRKLLAAYCDKFPLVKALYVSGDREFLLRTSAGRALLVNTAMISAKSTRDTQGVIAMTVKKGHRVIEVDEYHPGALTDEHRYRSKALPAAGAILKEELKQMSLDEPPESDV